MLLAALPVANDLGKRNISLALLMPARPGTVHAEPGEALRKVSTGSRNGLPRQRGRLSIPAMRILPKTTTMGTWGRMGATGIQVDGSTAAALRTLHATTTTHWCWTWGLDGQTVLERRDRDQRLPALILTARDSLDERVRSLNAGPTTFWQTRSAGRAGARLHALVRRAAASTSARPAGALVYDSARKQFTLRGEPGLSPREHAVLRVLVQRSGEPFSKQQILDRVFTDDDDVHPEAVGVCAPPAQAAGRQWCAHHHAARPGLRAGG